MAQQVNPAEIKHVKKPLVRPTFRIHADTYERAKYWADRENISVNQYMVDAIEEKIARASGAKPHEVSELVSVLNQILDQNQEVSSSLDNLTSVVSNVSRSFMMLTRGDNYLLDVESHEDGTLGPAGTTDVYDGMVDDGYKEQYDE